MLKLLVILVIKLNLQIVVGEHGETSGGYTRYILPLVLIRTNQNEFIHPTNIDVSMTYQQNFIFGTKFSASESGNGGSFFCGCEQKDRNAAMSIGEENVDSDDQYCTYELVKPESDAEPAFLKCTQEPQPFVEQLTEKRDAEIENEVLCKSDYDIQQSKAKMFAFMYEFKTNEDHKTGTFEVFRFCYDEGSRRVRFTEHVIRAPALLDPTNLMLNYERNKEYEVSSKSYGNFGLEYEMMKNAYEELKDIKKKKKYSDDVIKASPITHMALLSDQTLISPDDMLFALWKKATQHALNIMPMEDGKIRLWNYISECIRNDAIKNSREYRIYTGTFDLLHRSEYDKEIIKSPDFWIKIVHYKWETQGVENNQSIAVVMIHNPKLEEVKDFFQIICNENLCKDQFNEIFPEYSDSVCCVHPGVVGNYFFGLELYNHDVLRLII